MAEKLPKHLQLYTILLETIKFEFFSPFPFEMGCLWMDARGKIRMQKINGILESTYICLHPLFWNKRRIIWQARCFAIIWGIWLERDNWILRKMDRSWKEANDSIRLNLLCEILFHETLVIICLVSSFWESP